ncbi:MAG: glucosaminidase domain-containing protein [Paludibacteraceae bacterium]|nr:glucosaminidase domain-containing protein [Paludibacteraceae bacterium]
MKKIVFISIVVLVGEMFSLVDGQNITKSPEYEAYIEAYKQMAISSKERYGIPAAITMAQGLLESSAGKSNLAVECNNHFGIKCGSSWYGETMKKDDDSAEECFRCYASAQASFDDHSEFLMKQRYAFLFDYQITDYISWAKGLKQAGYATDPKYPAKLIGLIELYELYKLDGGRNLNGSEVSTEDVTIDKQSKEVTPSSVVTERPVQKSTVEEQHNDLTEPKNSNTNDGKKITKKVKEEKTAQEAKEMKREGTLKGYTIIENNGVRCVEIRSKETFKKISKAVNISVNWLLYLNDLPRAVDLEAGDYVYLAMKKGTCDKSMPVYTVKTGDSMHSISQRFGIRLRALYRINGMVYGTPARAGQTIKLHR